MTIYKVGQVWERNDRRREIVLINEGANWLGTGNKRDSTEGLRTFYLHWRRPGGGKINQAWCSTWFEWASKATLVDEGKA